MKNTTALPTRPTLRGLVLALAVTVLSSQVAQAHPYASGISNVSGNIKFILNENADDVKVVFDNGTSATNDLGALTQGVNSFALGSHTNYSIIVSKVGTGQASLISVDTNRFVNFWGPRGVTVNRNPKTANFGRVYVAVSSPGTQPLGGVSSANGTRVVTRGVYAINADQTDAVGQGDTAKTFGMTLAASTTYSPHKLRVGPDDMLYVADGAGYYVGGITNGVYMVKPDLSSGVNLFPIDGTVPEVCGGVMGAPFAMGSYANGTLGLYAINWDMNGPTYGYQTVWLYTNFTTLPFTGTPTEVCYGGIGSVQGVYADMTIGPDGKIYTCEPRSTPSASSVPVRIFDPTGATELWDSWDNWIPAGGDPFALSRSIEVSSDGNMLMTANSSTGNFMTVQLTNGIPDISTFALVTTGFGATCYGAALDAANNVYLTSSGLGILRVYSLGMTTTAITGNDATCTNGTFQLISPTATASVVATQPDAHEAGPVTGLFTISRVANDLSGPLTVNFAYAGTAVLGKHYTASATNSIVIPAGQTTVTVTITPKEDNTPDPTLTVILNLKGGASYSAVVPASATVTIADDSPPFLQISALSTNIFEGNPYDYAQATITRWGDTNIYLVVDAPNFTCTGTAVSNVNYYVSNLPVAFNPGDVSHSIQLLFPINDNVYHLNKTITLGMVAGSGYTVSNSTFTTTLTEATLPTETVLWSDNLQTADSQTNWTMSFASLDPTTSDYAVDWGYDYSVYGIPPAPHSGTDTHGLRMTVNKNGNIEAAALNFYPIGQVFSNNYALRFDMYLTEGTVSTTEYALFGINHSGTKTNWFRNSGTGVPAGWVYDGLWYDVEADGAALGDYVLYSSPTLTNASLVVYPTSLGSRSAGTLTGVFKAPPYTIGAVGGGTPANQPGTGTPSWSEVEISQINKVITLKINNTVIFSYTNATTYTNGNIMLGYDDAYDSVGDVNASAIFANLQVVQIGLPAVTTPPANIVAAAGTTTNFTVVASTGTGVTSYQWLFNGAPLAGKTSATFTFSPVALANYGTYSVNASDGSYTSVSPSATLTPPAPAITTAPTSRAGATNGSVTFSAVAATYTGVTNYQWQFYGTNLTGKTSATLTLASLTSTSFGPYRVTVSDGFTTPLLTSTAAQLTAAVRQGVTPTVSGSVLNLGFNTEIGPSYVVEWKGVLTNGAWNQLKTNTGTGSLITVQDSPATAGSRYYRVRMQ